MFALSLSRTGWYTVWNEAWFYFNNAGARLTETEGEWSGGWCYK